MFIPLDTFIDQDSANAVSTMGTKLAIDSCSHNHTVTRVQLKGISCTDLSQMLTQIFLVEFHPQSHVGSSVCHQAVPVPQCTFARSHIADVAEAISTKLTMGCNPSSHTACFSTEESFDGTQLMHVLLTRCCTQLVDNSICGRWHSHGDSSC